MGDESVSARRARRVTLGLNAFTPNSSAALIVDGQYVGAAEEERFCGPKHAAVWPEHAIRFLLREAGLDEDEVTHVSLPFAPEAYSDHEHAPRFSREIISARAEAFLAARRRTEERLAYAQTAFPHAHVTGIEHHLAHASYAFASSEYPSAAVVVLDSVGETISSSVWKAHQTPTSRLEPIWAGPDYSSIGYFYGAVTRHLGWRSNDEEGTVMALAALGDPTRFRSLFEQLIQFDGFKLHIDSSLLLPRVRRVPPKFTDHFMQQVCQTRFSGDPVTPDHCDFAAAAQARLEELVQELGRAALRWTGCDKLVLAGGVAENCVANGKLAKTDGLTALHVPSAPGDAGTALGAALASHEIPLSLSTLKVSDPLVGDWLSLDGLAPGWRPVTGPLSASASGTTLADWCSQGNIVGLVNGRFEFGPRALGNRSLIACPEDAQVVERLNATIKKREAFRPFAPVVRAERVGDYVEIPKADVNLSSMTLALPTRGDNPAISSIAHANGLARIQTVTKTTSPTLWHALLDLESSGRAGILINTSLNVKGMPMCGSATILEDFVKQSKISNYLLNRVAYVS